MKTENKNCGVYCFRHKPTGRRYVGSSIDVFRRKRQHISASRCKSGVGNYCFHKAIRELGEASFEFEVLEICSPENRFEAEKRWIDFYNSASIDGFNTMDSPMARFDFSVNEITRQRMSQAAKKSGRRPPKRLNYKHSPETKLKMSIIAKAKGRKPPKFTGHKDPALLAKFSELMKGNKYALGYRHTDLARAKISASSLGNNHLLGKIRPQEVKQRISESMKRYRQQQRENRIIP